MRTFAIVLMVLSPTPPAWTGCGCADADLDAVVAPRANPFKEGFLDAVGGVNRAMGARRLHRIARGAAEVIPVTGPRDATLAGSATTAPAAVTETELLRRHVPSMPEVADVLAQ